MVSFTRSTVLAGFMAFAAVATAHYAQACSLADLSLTIDGTTYDPTACAYPVANGNPTQETANLNAAFSTSYVYLDKSDDVASTTGIGGIVFSVTASAGSTGTWSVSWSDTDLSTLPNLPIYADFAVGLFAASDGAGYQFTSVLLPISPSTGSGTFDISFHQNPAGAYPGISHLTLIGGQSTLGGGNQGGDVPEPASLLLLGSGLIGLGAVRRRLTRK